ncbi:MAG: formylglycine-generating enzyme family protein, partial [Bernardetiaceae bacterium]|nr:formylglycine-generating enzyme family protein [Bernardetiaceae bacterium]
GMYLPSLADAPSGELGGAAFQHPARKNHAYNGDIDDFPILVFLLSLKALSHSPELIDLVPKDDHLLLQSEDYKNAENSFILKTIWHINNSKIRELFGLFIISIRQEYIKVKRLPEFLNKELNLNKQNIINLRRENRMLKVEVTLKLTKMGFTEDSITSDRPKKNSNLKVLDRLFKTAPGDFIETINGVSFKMIYVEGGSFMMGYDPKRDGEDADDWIKKHSTPLHKVTLLPFYIAETQVTQALWEAVMSKNSSRFKGATQPVEQVSWSDCQEFIKKISKLTGREFRLPSEAQWEYAARGGIKSKDYRYAGSNDIDEVAWYGYEKSEKKTHPVAQKQANELGIYDMSGNVWEWCEDDWHNSYKGAPTNESAWIGSPRGSDCVARGGSWRSNARYARITRRYYDSPTIRHDVLGFRLCVLR